MPGPKPNPPESPERGGTPGGGDGRGPGGAAGVNPEAGRVLAAGVAGQPEAEPEFEDHRAQPLRINGVNTSGVREAGAETGPGAEPETEPETEAETESGDELEDGPQDGPRGGDDTDMGTLTAGSMLGNSIPAEGGRRPAQWTDWSSASDAEIMLRVREGDDSGFDLLITKYRKAMVNFMYRMVRNQPVAEELAQEVFLRVYRSRQTYRAEAKFTTWLYRIATNLAVNHARDNKHERAALNVYLNEPDAETGMTPDLADETPTVEQDILRRERMQAIRQHVMALPERQKMAVLMHKYQDMDYKQIGEVLKLSESATKSLLFRAYQTLRERLKGFV